uniref:Uncharacterized protein n=2 Tax=unclassified bacterial viruses TaxID=12333 RepID=A0AAU6VZN4_9VIRU
MEILGFVAFLAVIALLGDVSEKYHERQMAKEKHFKETIYD